MLKRHSPTTPAELLDHVEIAEPVYPPKPRLSAAQRKRVAKIKRELKALKKKLAQVLRVTR